MTVHRVADLVTVVARSAEVGLLLVAVALIHIARGNRQARQKGLMKERMSDTKARQRALEISNRSGS